MDLSKVQNLGELNLRSVVVRDGNYVINVAPQSVENALLDEEGNVKPEYCWIDDEISYYVTDRQFETLSDDELEELVNREGYDWKN